MAKKPARGGRVTPKGTQPAGTQKSTTSGTNGPDHRSVRRIDPAAGRQSFGPIGPTRSGHHHGQR